MQFTYSTFQTLKTRVNRRSESVYFAERRKRGFCGVTDLAVHERYEKTSKGSLRSGGFTVGKPCVRMVLGWEKRVKEKEGGMRFAVLPCENWVKFARVSTTSSTSITFFRKLLSCGIGQDTLINSPSTV